MTTPQKESIELLAASKYPKVNSNYLTHGKQANVITDIERAAFIAGYSAALEEQKERAVTSNDIDSYFRKMKIDISKPIPVALVIELMEGFTKSFLSTNIQ